MKGIVLAGGSGSRLNPITKAVSKQLLPVGDKPMIYYPLSCLMEGGIKEILVISTPDDISSYKKLLGTGSHIGINIHYKIQEKPEGLAQAFILGKDFIGDEDVCLILGDNIFYGVDFFDVINKCKVNASNGIATIFGCKVDDPERFGVADFDDNFNLKSIEEKPEKPKSNYAVVGFYSYPNNVIDKVNKLRPSKRGELEITSLNEIYLREEMIKINILQKDFLWFDTGTYESLLDASNKIDKIEKDNYVKIGCIEEIAFRKKLICEEKLNNNITILGNNSYSDYLKSILNNK